MADGEPAEPAEELAMYFFMQLGHRWSESLMLHLAGALQKCSAAHVETMTIVDWGDCCVVSKL